MNDGSIGEKLRCFFLLGNCCNLSSPRFCVAGDIVILSGLYIAYLHLTGYLTPLTVFSLPYVPPDNIIRKKCD